MTMTATNAPKRGRKPAPRTPCPDCGEPGCWDAKRFGMPGERLCKRCYGRRYRGNPWAGREKVATPPPPSPAAGPPAAPAPREAVPAKPGEGRAARLARVLAALDSRAARPAVAPDPRAYREAAECHGCGTTRGERFRAEQPPARYDGRPLGLPEGAVLCRRCYRVATASRPVDAKGA